MAHSDDAALPLFCPTGVMIAPVQTELVAAKLTMDGQDVVGIQANTPTGVQFYFMSPDIAKRFARALDSVASGIILAPSGKVVA